MLLTTGTNLNDKKTCQGNKIRYKNLEQRIRILCSQTLGACPPVELKPHPLSLSTVFISSCFNNETELFNNETELF